MTSSTLDEQLDVRSAEPWYPWKKEGAGQPEKITGEVAAIDSVYSDYQQDLRLIAVIRDVAGAAWSIRTYPTRLHAEWLRLQPQVGEKVAVKFCGMCTRKQDGKQYPDFALAVERQQPGKFDYGKVGTPAGVDGESTTDLAARVQREVAEAKLAKEREEADGEPVAVGVDPGPDEGSNLGDWDDSVPF